MNRIKIGLIILIAIVGAYLIYNHFDKIREEENKIDKFTIEYTLLNENHIYKYRSIDEIIDIISNGTGIIFMCTPDSDWCQRYALYLNNSLKQYGIEEVNYINIKNYRAVNGAKYKKLLELLDSYIYRDDAHQGKIIMPDLTFVKDGKIIAHDNETALVTSDNNPGEYWNQDRINDFNNKIFNYVNLMNQEYEIEGVE